MRIREFFGETNRKCNSAHRRFRRLSLENLESKTLLSATGWEVDNGDVLDEVVLDQTANHTSFGQAYTHLPVPQAAPYSQDFDSGQPGAAEGWEYFSTNDGRIEVVNGQLQMDDAVNGGTYALNEAILHLDLAGQSGVVLTLDHTRLSDETDNMPTTFQGRHNSDGIAFSADGVNWYRLTQLDSSFTGQSFDLDAAVQAAGIQYTSDFQIKFQQYDNYSANTDGRTFDNIRVESGSSDTDFDIDVVFTDNSLSSAQQALFQQAAQRWESIIVADVPDENVAGIGLVDDVRIVAVAQYIDGPGGILGGAGPDHLRTGSFLPATGQMIFDTVDLAGMDNQTFTNVILHEMGHVLGIGTIWSNLGLLSGAGSSDPRFLGPNAVAEYNQIFGNTESSVPVANTGGQGTRDAHWRESVFGTELMTGYMALGANPISRVTVGSLADLGYTVDYAAADPYQPLQVSADGGASAIPLGRMIAISPTLPALPDPETVDKEPSTGTVFQEHVEPRAIELPFDASTTRELLTSTASSLPMSRAVAVDAAMADLAKALRDNLLGDPFGIG